MKHEATTQEDVLLSASYKGFASGPALPEQTGDLTKFKIVHIEAEENDSPNKIMSRIIERLGETRKWDAAARTYQLIRLIEQHAGPGKIFITIIANAHRLNLSTIESLRSMTEWQTNCESGPGFVLLGDMIKLYETIDKSGSIKYRTKKTSGLRLVRF